MRASSTATLQKALTALRNTLGGPTPSEQGITVAEQLLELEDLFSADVRFARAVSDPARSEQNKQQLVENLFSSRTEPCVVEALKQLAAGRWSSEKDLGEACHLMAVHVLLKTALDEQRLERLQSEIFALGRVLHDNRDLRLRLSERQTPKAQRQALISRLIGSQVCPETLVLAKDAVGRAKPGRLQSGLRSISYAASAMRGRISATVTTAHQLSDAQLERLSSLLEKQNGKEVEINVVVNPDIIGGLRVNLEQTVLDATLRASLEDSKRQLRAG